MSLKKIIDEQTEKKADEGTSVNAFDLNKYKLTQNFAELANVKKVILTIPVVKPDPQLYIRCHPDENFQFRAGVIELKKERELYLVDPDIASRIPGELVIKMFFTSITRLGDLFLWSIKLPGEDGKIDTWNRSALEAAKIAMKKWVRVKSNKPIGSYDVHEAQGDLPEPEWPDMTMQEIAEIAFKGTVIDSLDHSVIKNLHGKF